MGKGQNTVTLNQCKGRPPMEWCKHHGTILWAEGPNGGHYCAWCNKFVAVLPAASLDLARKQAKHAAGYAAKGCPTAARLAALDVLAALAEEAVDA